MKSDTLRPILLLAVSCLSSTSVYGFVLTRDATSRGGSSLFVHHEEEDVEKPAAARRDVSSSKMFAMGKNLKNLRMDLESLRDNLQWAEALDDKDRVRPSSKGNNVTPHSCTTKPFG